MRYLTLLVVLFIPLLGSSLYGQFEVGVGKQIITPDPLLPVSGGMGPSAPVTKKKGDITTRAMVVRQGDTTVAIVAVDVLGFPKILGDQARAKIKGIPVSHILIGASHTHSAPDCYAFPDGQGGHTGNLAYMRSVSDRIAAAVNDAVSNLRPARLKIATGEIHGKVAYNYYAPDLYDRRASVIQAIGSDDKVIGTLVNYAVHPEVLGASVGILSPDLIGPLCDRIEEKVGGMALFMNGALGGMITADNRDLNRPRDSQRGYWHDRREWSECLRIGGELADESLRIIAEAPIQTEPRLSCQTEDVRFPVDSDDMWAVVKYSPLKYPHDEKTRSISTTVNLVTLGNAQMLTIPGEALPNIGFYLKRKMRGEHNLLFGLTNDAFGYILTKVDFASFSRYDYISRVSLGENTGEIFIERALKMIEASPVRPSK